MTGFIACLKNSRKCLNLQKNVHGPWKHLKMDEVLESTGKCLKSSWIISPVWAPGCKNRPHSVSWPEVIKGIPNQGVDCLLARAVFSVTLLCFWCMLCCVWLFFLSVPVQLIAWKDLSPKCVEWDVKPYTLTHSWIIICSMLKVALNVRPCITSELYYKCVTKKFMSSFCHLLFIHYSICEHVCLSCCSLNFDTRV